MKKLIGGVVILVALVVGAYVGYRMVFKGETFFEALGATQQKVEDRLNPLRKADYHYGRGDYEEAVRLYKEALQRSDSPDATGKQKLTAEKRGFVLRRIADGQYEIAARQHWSAALAEEAERSYDRVLRECPNLSDEDRADIGKRTAKLKALAR